MNRNHMLIALAVTALAVALYRLYKRWTRRCEHCGSMWWFERWHEREYVRPVGGKKCEGVTTTYYKCNNPTCSHCGIESVEKSYHKVFSISKVTN